MDCAPAGAHAVGEMSRNLVVAAAAALALALVPAVQATVVPQQGLGGVRLGMTKAQVTAKLGQPPVRTRAKPIVWSYHRFWVTFRDGRVVDVSTTSGTELTAGGIGLYSTQAQILKAFPAAVCEPFVPYLRCRLGTGEPRTRVTDFYLGHGWVVQTSVTLLPG
jgi:hypothetical protein